jgi:hypothetical protein
VSETFETLCHEALPDFYPEYRLTQLPAQWWYKHHEIDVVVPTDQGTLIVGEAKFTNTPVGYDVLAKLENTADRIDWKTETGDNPDYEYVLFSRSGFKASVEEAATERDDLRLVRLTEIVETLESSIKETEE